MRTRNSATPKSPPPPKRPPPARRAAAAKASTPDSPSKPRETKRQAAIKARQAKINDATPPPNPPQPQDDNGDGANLGRDADEVTPQPSSGSNTGAKKGTKRTRGPAKCKAPAAQRMKLEERGEKNSMSGTMDVEMASAIGIQGEGNKEIDDSKEDIHSQMVTNDGLLNEPTEPSDVLMEEELQKETSETVDHLLTEDPKMENSEMKDHLLPVEPEKETSEMKDHLLTEELEKETSEIKNHLLTEELEKEKSEMKDRLLTEEPEKETSEMKDHLLAEELGKEASEWKDHLLTEELENETSEMKDRLLTDSGEPIENEETITVPIGADNGCQRASTEEHTFEETPGEDAKAEGTKNLNDDVTEGADDQYDQNEMIECEETNSIEIIGDPDDVADIEEDTLEEMAVKVEQSTQVAGADGESGEMNVDVDADKFGETLSMDGDNRYEDAEEVMTAEGDEEPGYNIEGMDGERKEHVKDDEQVSNADVVVECLKGPESDKNQVGDVISDLTDEKDEPKVGENSERNTRDSVEEGDKFEEEHREWTAVAKERRIKKEHEIFVREISGNTKEDELRKVFEEIGEVIEVRLHKQSLSNKNKGYAFVRFANKEHVRRALSEMKDPIIGGLSCSIGPSEDNDTLFLGNICNTWAKEAINQKLKEYGVEGVVNITLVPDAQREGFSRGFAFLEFSCHDDAVVAYQRLQKPDVIFGHAERTAKVAFAEPLRDPDPDVMLKVKTVFVDGLPSTCDEKYVREQVKDYGEIDRIVLARNMTTAKRKDFGFIHFTTHEAAVACIDGINNSGLGDENSKTKIKARLSNPLPKTQAVKGGMAGGFRVGFSSIGGSSKPGRGIGRDGHLNRQGVSDRGRGSYQRGYGQSGRASFSRGYHLDSRVGSRVSGQGSRGGFRPRGEVPVIVGPFIPNHIRPMGVPGGTNLGMQAGSREPFRFDRGFGRHPNRRQFDDSNAYGHRADGIKRPSYMTGLDAGYVDPSRHPRLNYADPPNATAAPYSSHGTQFQDTRRPPLDIRPPNHYGPPANPRPHDYYGPPASARPHDYYGPPASARPHNYYGPPASAPPPEYYRPPASAPPPEYYGPPTSARPPEYHRPPPNIHPQAHSRPDYIGGPHPPAYRGNPPYGGGFQY
uniref:RRM domain-containing protein n=1 Tax=Kalanchoe fedtschenkoi TaxID=63787 RepID=A0A7N0UBV3_KALFE